LIISNLQKITIFALFASAYATWYHLKHHMDDAKNIVDVQKRFPAAEVAICLGLFMLALLPRAYALERFVTADEAKWVYRSAQFLAAFLQGDLAGTSVNLTPAVTTTWLGSLGLAIYYQLNRVDLHMPLTQWLLSLPEFRTEMPILSATRWPMAILTSAGVVTIYLLTRRLLKPLPAFIAAVFIALDPHFVALSRILGHDAPTATFMSISILLLLLASQDTEEKKGQQKFPISQSPNLLISLSGLCAGLSFISKAPAFFLLPFTGLLFLSKMRGKSARRYSWVKQFILWLGMAYLAFILFWPAAWVDPLGRPLAVIENGFLSATDEEEAEAENYWRVPDLGPWFYLVNGAFKLSPLVTVGLIAVVGFGFIQMRRSSSNLPISSPLFWLLLFAFLFTFFMTLGEKRSARYILPIFPPLAILAAAGWCQLISNYQLTNEKDLRTAYDLQGPFGSILRFTLPAVLTFSALIILLPYSPYYFTYFNPLVGGPYTAPHWVKIGWGEGLDQVGRFLQREQPNSRVGTPYASTVAPFFKGDLSDVTGDKLDFVVLYRKQVQSGEPLPAFIRYFEQIGSIFSVTLNGIHYADVYPGPAVQPALALPADGDRLPRPTGFRPLTPYGSIGQSLTVDVLWLATDPLPVEPATIVLQPLGVLDIQSQEGSVEDRPEPDASLAEGQGQLMRMAEELIVSRHQLLLPEALRPGSYALLVNDWPLGEIEIRRFQTPATLGAVKEVVFGDQIALTGYQFYPGEDYIRVNLAWQARQSHLPDYTVFAQLLAAETNERVAGVDVKPLKGEWPTSRWVKDEVVVDEYLIAIPPNFPPGYYKVIVGLYQPETGQRLALANGQDFWLVPWTFIRER
jgi:predicted membrane-bound dolichyl-phosphate-mannose-protein mannosyltransferase